MEHVNYNNGILLLFGLLGVLLHNLVEMNKLNRANEGQINIAKYWAMEKFSIAINIIVTGVSVIASDEIKELDFAGNFLGLGFLAIGYMGQSVLVWFMGKASEKIEK